MEKHHQWTKCSTIQKPGSSALIELTTFFHAILLVFLSNKPGKQTTLDTNRLRIIAVIRQEIREIMMTGNAYPHTNACIMLLSPIKTLNFGTEQRSCRKV